MTKKKKLESLHQADGMLHKGPGAISLKTIQDIFGGEGYKYKINNASDYKNYLKEMNKVDLQKEATKNGLIPIDDRMVLEERLMKEFNKYNLSFNGLGATTKIIKPSKKLSDLLAEGA